MEFEIFYSYRRGPQHYTWGDRSRQLAQFLQEHGFRATAREVNQFSLFGKQLDPASWLFLVSSDGWFSFVENKDGPPLYYPVLTRMKECRCVIKNQYIPGIYGDLDAKVKPGIYAEQHPILFNERLPKYRKVKKDRRGPYFRGALKYSGRREILTEMGLPTVRGVDSKEYFAELSRHQVGLAISGMGNICHREIEYTALGVVPLMFPHVSQMLHPLVAGEHFIATKPVPVEENRNNKLRARRYQEAFEAAIEQPAEIERMSHNCMKWYDRYVRYPACARILAQQMGIIP